MGINLSLARLLVMTVLGLWEAGEEGRAEPNVSLHLISCFWSGNCKLSSTGDGSLFTQHRWTGTTGVVMSVGQTGHKVCLSHIDAHPRRIIQMWKRSYTEKHITRPQTRFICKWCLGGGEGGCILDICAPLGLSALYSMLFQFVQSVHTYFLNLHFYHIFSSSNSQLFFIF